MDMRFGKVIKHIVFWALFLLLWSLHDFNYHDDLLENLETNVFAFIPYAGLVYFNLYFLMPRFLLKRKVTGYVLLLTGSIIITTLLSSHYLSFYFGSINIHQPTANFFISFPGKIAIATEVILSLCLSMTLFLIDEWYRKDRLMHEIEQKQLETELNLLKHQINPHFLFNSLNSIYVMLGKHLESGKKMLLQFSEILSHQLYEANKKSITLKSEFENLQNYIDIESTRHGDFAKVAYSFPESSEKLTIAPMLLLPLVENAFKHGQSSTGYGINVDANVEFGHTLSFTVENSVFNGQNQRFLGESKGIGLANVKRRLELIYPNRHILDIASKNATFKVHLKVQLHENEMFDS